MIIYKTYIAKYVNTYTHTYPRIKYTYSAWYRSRGMIKHVPFPSTKPKICIYEEKKNDLILQNKINMKIYIWREKKRSNFSKLKKNIYIFFFCCFAIYFSLLHKKMRIKLPFFTSVSSIKNARRRDGYVRLPRTPAFSKIL